MNIGFYQDYGGECYTNIRGLDAICQNPNEIEIYVMIEEHIPQ